MLPFPSTFQVSVSSLPPAADSDADAFVLLISFRSRAHQLARKWNATDSLTFPAVFPKTTDAASSPCCLGAPREETGRRVVHSLFVRHSRQPQRRTFHSSPRSFPALPRRYVVVEVDGRSTFVPVEVRQNTGLDGAPTTSKHASGLGLGSRSEMGHSRTQTGGGRRAERGV